MFGKEGSRKYLNWPERAAFLRVVEREPNLRDRTFCLALFYTGCRISEALNLTKNRVDAADGALVFETLKRRKRGCFRSVPVPTRLAAQLQTLATGSDGRIWPFSRTTAYRIVKEKMAAAEIEGIKASPKGLRHSFAVACLSRDVPLTVEQKWLGHARLETTAIYLEIGGKEERRLAQRVWSTHGP